jgi:hypothetical protein
VTGSLVALVWFAAGCGPTGSRHVQAGQITADADTEEGGTGGGTPTGGRPAVDASPNTGGSPATGGATGDTGGSGGATGGASGTGGSIPPDAASAPDLAVDQSPPDTAPDAAQTCVTGMAATFLNTPMTSQTGTFTVRFTASVSATPSNGIVALSMGPQTGFAGYAAAARFNPMGMIDAVNGAAYEAAASIPYSVNTSYQFRLMVNVTAHTYSVFVTPAGGTERMVGSGFAFRTGQTSLTRLDSWGVAMQSMATGTLKACAFAPE